MLKLAEPSVANPMRIQFCEIYALQADSIPDHFFYIDGMSLREKVVIAQLNEHDLPCLQYTFDVCIGMDDEKGKE
jgi:hypothetical protein